MAQASDGSGNECMKLHAHIKFPDFLYSFFLAFCPCYTHICVLYNNELL